MSILIGLCSMFVHLLAFAILARAVTSWLPIDRNGPVVRALDAITDPVLDPLRRVIPTIGMIDITPMVAMIMLFAIGGALEGAA